MPRNSGHLVEAQSNTIRRLIEENKQDMVIIKLLQIGPDTSYWYKRRVQRQDAKIWESSHGFCKIASRTINSVIRRMFPI